MLTGQGKGKYDDLCTEARTRTEARGAVLMIIDGKEGWGFSIQAEPLDILALPKALRYMADQIDEQHKKGELFRWIEEQRKKGE